MPHDGADEQGVGIPLVHTSATSLPRRRAA